MGDITDLFSTVSRTRVSPQKSYVASYGLTTSYTDTGVTLQVANGQFYSVIYTIQGIGGGFNGTVNSKLLEGATTKQTFSTAFGASSIPIASQIFQNTSGSTQTVKLQSQYVTNATSLLDIQLISGTIVSEISNNTTIPINAYVTNLEMVGSSHNNTMPVGLLNLSQLPTVSTTSLVSNLNLYISGFNASADNLYSAGQSKLGYVAFDFDGKTLAL
ncbi:MAG: hypothetical protein KGI08_10345 [Thaumarchaeota archaeon]|nr:hypothetical protein [Nitrososphaerota archaeon]